LTAVRIKMGSEPHRVFSTIARNVFLGSNIKKQTD